MEALIQSVAPKDYIIIEGIARETFLNLKNLAVEEIYHFLIQGMK